MEFLTRGDLLALLIDRAVPDDLSSSVYLYPAVVCLTYRQIIYSFGTLPPTAPSHSRLPCAATSAERPNSKLRPIWKASGARCVSALA